ncbi:hypothetical protein H920_01993 [Fukomys damarensis]|uniref:Uncharacterized protein n=1 Tax=Fukomys damarensis TaxID=885580 RepID=A0A091E1M9_FUKDA|nr:hypothetical protein H920_01993 [Fukomys damarensis]
MGGCSVSALSCEGERKGEAGAGDSADNCDSSRRRKRWTGESLGDGDLHPVSRRAERSVSYLEGADAKWGVAASRP